MSKLIILVEDHYIGRVTWRGQVAIKVIKDKFEELDLLERAKGCPFKQFFQASPMQFSRVIIHQIFLRMKASSKNGLQFEIGGNKIRFRIGEFTLNTRLNFGVYPKEEMSHSRRLVSIYLNDNSLVKSHEVEVAFRACNDKEDSWKFEIVYFIDSMLFSHKANSKVEMSLFSMVESEEDFFQVSFLVESPLKRLLFGLDRDMVYFRALYMEAR